MLRTTTLFRPANAWFGDVMPIHVDGKFHLLYTRLDADDLGGPGVLKGLDWGHLVTSDFVSFEERPTAIARGDASERDLLVGAGSVLRADDATFVAFYGGINPARGERGLPTQVVMRATSTDLVHWEKDPDWELVADPRWYEADDWRDPFVYRDADTWRMVVCTRVRTGPHDRRGAIGSAVSTDLTNWTIEPPLLSPGSTYAPECPEIFELDGRGYLVYSTYSDRFATRHRIWDDHASAWVRPDADALESNDVYAMSTVSDGERRYLVGWLSTRSGDSDTGHRQWGGDLVAHELRPRPDSTLGTHPIDAVISRYDAQPAALEPRDGDWAIDGGNATFEGTDFGWASAGTVGEQGLLDVTVHLDDSAEEVGIAVRASSDFGSAYLLRFEPTRGRVVFDRRPHRIDVPFDMDSDRSYVSAADHEIERPIDTSGPIRCRIMVEGSAIVAYIGDVALTTRGYDLDGGAFGLYAAGGRARFSGARVGTLR